jgi:hypothetical protein
MMSQVVLDSQEDQENPASIMDNSAEVGARIQLPKLRELGYHSFDTSVATAFENLVARIPLPHVQETVHSIGPTLLVVHSIALTDR